MSHTKHDRSPKPRRLRPVYVEARASAKGHALTLTRYLFTNDLLDDTCARHRAALASEQLATELLRSGFVVIL